VWHLPLSQASEHLGVSAPQLLARCRKMGLDKWPHDKLRSYQALINRLRQMVHDRPTAASRGEPLQVRPPRTWMPMTPCYTPSC
jgi:hypothetical protein